MKLPGAGPARAWRSFIRRTSTKPGWELMARPEDLVEVFHHLVLPGRIHFQVHVKLDRLVMSGSGSAAGEEADSQETKKTVASIHAVILPHAGWWRWEGWGDAASPERFRRHAQADRPGQYPGWAGPDLVPRRAPGRLLTRLGERGRKGEVRTRCSFWRCFRRFGSVGEGPRKDRRRLPESAPGTTPPKIGRTPMPQSGYAGAPRTTPLRPPFPVGARKDAGARLEGRHSWRPLSSVGCARSSAAGRLGAFLRSSPTGPGPAKSCVKRSGGFPTPTPSGGLKVPPPIRATPAPPGPSESNRREEGDKNVPPPGAPWFSQTKGDRSFRSFSGWGRGEEEHGRGEPMRPSGFS